MKKTFSPQTAALLWPCNRVKAHAMVFSVCLPLHPMKTCYCRLCQAIPGRQCSALLYLALLCFGASLLSRVVTHVCLASITAEVIATFTN